MTIFLKNSQALAIALTQIFITEEAGPANNPKILKYAQDCGFKNYISDDIAWCSLFMNWIAFQMGLRGTASLMAKSWLDYGEKVITEPAVGDIAILWRGSPEADTGHVGLYLNEITREGKTNIRLLAGNQNDQVKISEFPKEQVLVFRRW